MTRDEDEIVKALSLIDPLPTTNGRHWLRCKDGKWVRLRVVESVYRYNAPIHTEWHFEMMVTDKEYFEMKLRGTENIEAYEHHTI